MSFQKTQISTTLKSISLLETVNIRVCVCMCNIIGQKAKGNASRNVPALFNLVSYSLSDLVVSSISEDGRKYMQNYAQTHPKAFL
jgi:hypothetical protein